MRLSPSVFVLLIAGFSLVTFACDDSGAPVEVRTDFSASTVIVDHGETRELAVPDRDALLVILDGILTPQGAKRVEIDRVIDAEIYAGPSDPIGDPHWITRARVLNQQGHTLWTQRVNSLFQMLEFLNPVLEEFSPVEISLSQLYQVTRQFYPELIQFAVKVPHRIDGAHLYILEVSDGEGNWERIAAFPIEELVEQAEPPQVDFEVEPLLETGPPRDRINVAIVGDGYTEFHRGAFEAHSEAVAERLMETSPFREHRDLFNISRVWTPSNEIGASFDCNHPEAASACEQDFRDTYFQTTFVIPALESEFGEVFGFDLEGVSDRVALPIRLARVFEAASLAHYDEIIFISNSRKRSGFAGAYVAVVTAFDPAEMDHFPDVAVHEVGHTLGLLGDEYNISGDACYYNEPDIPLPVNIDRVEDGELPRWSEWIAEDTPVPTPVSEDYANTVGAFEGAYNCDFLVRPVDRCMMRTSGHDFCPVCAEQMVRRFYSFVDPAPIETGPVVSVDRHQGVTIDLPIRDADDRYEVMWIVDDDVFATDQHSVEITPDQGLSSDGWLSVTALVRNQSDFLQTSDEATTSSLNFRLRLAD